MKTVTMRSAGVGVIALACVSLTWARSGASPATPASKVPGQGPSGAEERSSTGASATLFSRLSVGLRSIAPFAPTTATVSPASAAIGDSVIAREKGAESVPEARRAPITTRRAAPLRSTEEVSPRGIQVMRVPVPTALEGREAIDWTIRAEPTVTLLSATAGSVPQAAMSDARAATVVVRVPASATAGLLPIGEATFANGTDAVVVPLELIVTRVRRAALTSTRPAFAGVSGRKTVLAFDVANTGNSLDTFDIRIETLDGWKTTPVPVTILRPGERRRAEVTVDIPATVGTTAAYPQARVYAGGQEIAVTTLFMNVTTDGDHSESPGPDLVVAAASVLGDSIGASPVFGFDLRGPIGRGVTVMGRAAIASDISDVNYVGLSRAGIVLGGAFLSANAAGWSATVGTTGSTISDLTGVGVFGIGASGSVATGSVRTSAIVVNSHLGGTTSAGARIDKTVGNGTLGISGSHLQDGFLIGRTLDAVGLVATAAPARGLKLNGEVAWRSFTGGEGIGATASAQHTTANSFVSISGGHAPGGTSAYARATDEASIATSRRVTDWMALRADAYLSGDKPATGGTFNSSGFAVAPAFALPHGATLETEVRRNDYSSASLGRGFGNGETQLSGTMRGSIERTRWVLGGSYAFGSRTSDDDFLNLHSDQSYRRSGILGGLGWSFQRLNLDLGADYSRSAVVSGYFPRQLRLAATATRIQLFNNPRLPVFGTNIEYTTWLSETQKPVLVARVGTEMMIARDLALMIDVERNPLIRPSNTHTPWVAAVRLSKSTRLGWAFSEPKVRGMVYQDANANGRRDAGENGMQGVMVRRGISTAITDASGRWIFAGRDGNAPSIDPVSLPIGQVVGADSGARVAGSELAVIPTSPLTIKLQPVADSLGRLPTGTPDQVVILARDASGNEWSLRADAEGVVRFDALPPGLYTLGADFSGGTERLRIAGEAPVIEVRAGVALDVVALRYQLRPVRVFNGASAGRTGR